MDLLNCGVPGSSILIKKLESRELSLSEKVAGDVALSRVVTLFGLLVQGSAIGSSALKISAEFGLFPLNSDRSSCKVRKGLTGGEGFRAKLGDNCGGE